MKKRLHILFVLTASLMLSGCGGGGGGETASSQTTTPSLINPNGADEIPNAPLLSSIGSTPPMPSVR